MRVRVGLTAFITVLVMVGLFYFGMVTGGFSPGFCSTSVWPWRHTSG